MSPKLGYDVTQYYCFKASILFQGKYCAYGLALIVWQCITKIICKIFGGYCAELIWYHSHCSNVILPFDWQYYHSIDASMAQLHDAMSMMLHYPMLVASLLLLWCYDATMHLQLQCHVYNAMMLQQYLSTTWFWEYSAWSRSQWPSWSSMYLLMGVSYKSGEFTTLFHFVWSSSSSLYRARYGTYLTPCLSIDHAFTPALSNWILHGFMCRSNGDWELRMLFPFWSKPALSSGLYIIRHKSNRTNWNCKIKYEWDALSRNELALVLDLNKAITAGDQK